MRKSLFAALGLLMVASMLVTPATAGSGDTGWFSSMALDSDGHPHIAYVDATNNDIKYVQWTGYGWDIQTVDHMIERYGWPSLALALNPNTLKRDIPCISYGSNGNLMYVKWTDLGWDKQTADGSTDDVGGWTSLALDSNERPCISYYDWTNRDLMYVHWTGSKWETERVDSTGDVGGYTSLAITSSNLPCISYYDYTTVALKYAQWNELTSIWDKVTVDPDNAGSDSSLALDSGDRPCISYKSYSIVSGGLKYAHYDGTWHIETVDFETVDSRSGFYTGLSTSIALTAGDIPYISYIGWLSDQYVLKYAYWNDPVWIKDALDWTTDPFGTSIALSGGQPCISYYDMMFGDLLYVYWTSGEKNWRYETVSIGSSSAEVSVSPVICAVGDSITLSGTGFKHGEFDYDINIYFHNTLIDTAYMTDIGDFSKTLTVPDYYEGQHTISAMDKSNDEDSAPIIIVEKLKPYPVQATFFPDINNDEIWELVSGKDTAVLVYVKGLTGINYPLTVTFTGAGPPISLLESAAVNGILLFKTFNPASNIPNPEIKLYDNDGNLLSTVTVNTKTTRDLYVTYVPLKSPHYTSTSTDDLNTMMGYTNSMLASTYPVANTHANLASITSGENNMYDDAINAKALAVGNGDEFGVAIGPAAADGKPDYFTYHGYSEMAGVSWGPSLKGVVVLDGYYSAGAHEIGHTLGSYWYDPEEYEINEVRERGDPGYQAIGVNVIDNDIAEGWDIMGIGALSDPDYNWVTTSTYVDLFKKLKDPTSDPDLILVNGAITKDGTVTYSDLPWYRLKGTKDEIVPGGYSLQFRSEGGLLGETSFAAWFGMCLDPFGFVELDVAPFCFAVEIPEGTTEIAIMDNTGPEPQEISLIPTTNLPVYPRANAGGPYESFTGMVITFDASGSTGEDLTYRWDFNGDGVYDTDWTSNPTATHTYNSEWSGEAVLEVTDGHLTQRSEAQVTIMPFESLTVSGYKFFDANGDGARDAGEPGLSNWVIKMERGGSAYGSATTDENGHYEITIRDAGTYSIYEDLPDGWKQTTPDPGTYTFTVVSGHDEEVDFGNWFGSSSLVTTGGLRWFDVDTSTTTIREFKLILTPDVPTYPAYHRLTASNPGQFTYNVFYVGEVSVGGSFAVSLPPPFVTQGANPVRLYGSLDTPVEGRLVPKSEITSKFSVDTANPQNIVITANEGITGGFVYITIHADYGYKKTEGGYVKSSDNAIKTMPALDPSKDILNGAAYRFRVDGPSSWSSDDRIYNMNVFKKDPGIGGLVLDDDGYPLASVKVQIYQGTKLIGTVYTDSDGWYMWAYKYTGKPATFTVKLPAYGLSQTQILKSNSFLVINFTVASK